MDNYNYVIRNFEIFGNALDTKRMIFFYHEGKHFYTLRINIDEDEFSKSNVKLMIQHLKSENPNSDPLVIKVNRSGVFRMITIDDKKFSYKLFGQDIETELTLECNEILIQLLLDIEDEYNNIERYTLERDDVL